MLNRWVLSRDRKTATEGAEVTNSGRLFQTRAAATGKARSPTVESRVRLTISDEDELERSRWRVVVLCVFTYGGRQRIAAGWVTITHQNAACMLWSDNATQSTHDCRHQQHINTVCSQWRRQHGARGAPQIFSQRMKNCFRGIKSILLGFWSIGRYLPPRHKCIRVEWFILIEMWTLNVILYFFIFLYTYFFPFFCFYCTSWSSCAIS